MADSSSTAAPSQSGRPSRARGVVQGSARTHAIILRKALLNDTTLGHVANADLYADDVVIPLVISLDLAAAYNHINSDLLAWLNPACWTPPTAEKIESLD